jgi:hypothetical protein
LPESPPVSFESRNPTETGFKIPKSSGREVVVFDTIMPSIRDFNATSAMSRNSPEKYQNKIITSKKYIPSVKSGAIFSNNGIRTPVLIDGGKELWTS